MAFIRNVGRVAEQVKLVLADGTTAWARVMPRNKGVVLPDGAKIDSQWSAQYGKFIKMFEGQHPAWSSAASSSTTPKA
jgi:hypothetical protein